jgi:hypothetical protein
MIKDKKWIEPEVVKELYQKEYEELTEIMDKDDLEGRILKYELISNILVSEKLRIENFCVLSLFITMPPARKQNSQLLVSKNSLTEVECEKLVSNFNSKMSVKSVKYHKITGVFFSVCFYF